MTDRAQALRDGSSCASPDCVTLAYRADAARHGLRMLGITALHNEIVAMAHGRSRVRRYLVGGRGKHRIIVVRLHHLLLELLVKTECLALLVPTRGSRRDRRGCPCSVEALARRMGDRDLLPRSCERITPAYPHLACRLVVSWLGRSACRCGFGGGWLRLMGLMRLIDDSSACLLAKCQLKARS